MDQNQKDAKEWFLTLRDDLVDSLEKIENKEFLFKNFVVTEGDISRDYDIDERNSSSGFYRLQKEIRRSLETRVI